MGKMLEFTSKRPVIEFKVDGAVRSIPVTLEANEFKELGAFMEQDAGGGKFFEWFEGLVTRYAGDDFDITDAILIPLMRAWNEERQKLGLSQGEQKASPTS